MILKLYILKWLITWYMKFTWILLCSAWWIYTHHRTIQLEVQTFFFSFFFNTKQAQPCLASEIRRDRAPSGWYGRSPDIFLKDVFVCLVVQFCPTLSDFMDCSPPGSFIHGILQARILEWVAMPFSRGSSRPRDWTQVSCIAGNSLISEPQWYKHT